MNNHIQRCGNHRIIIIIILLSHHIHNIPHHHDRANDIDSSGCLPCMSQLKCCCTCEQSHIWNCHHSTIIIFFIMFITFLLILIMEMILIHLDVFLVCLSRALLEQGGSLLGAPWSRATTYSMQTQLQIQLHTQIQIQLETQTWLYKLWGGATTLAANTIKDTKQQRHLIRHWATASLPQIRKECVKKYTNPGKYKYPTGVSGAEVPVVGRGKQAAYSWDGELQLLPTTHFIFSLQPTLSLDYNPLYR